MNIHRQVLGLLYEELAAPSLHRISVGLSGCARRTNYGVIGDVVLASIVNDGHLGPPA